VPAEQSDEILCVLKATAAALRDAGIEFALAGGLSAWARGGPPTEHDIDYFLKDTDRDAALAALVDIGLDTEVPPEGWLVKARCKNVLVDLIFNPRGITVDDELLDRCDTLNVHAVDMRVIPLDDLLVGKLLVLNEHNLDFGPPLEWARALREQICWREVGRRTRESPFARAFFHLLVELDVLVGDSELVVR
jgi:hypothetical protein